MDEPIKTPEVEVNAEQQPQTEQGKESRPPKVVFSEEQQARVNELIREAMGRAGREVRTERDQLKAELETLRQEHEKIKVEATITREQAQATGKENLILALAAKYGFVKPEQVSKLAGDRIVFDDSARQFVVKNDDGSVAAGPDGKPVPVEAFISAFASENPHLVRGDVRLGTGSVESRQWTGSPNTAETVKQLFGRGSDSRKANELAMRDPNEYRRLKREAMRLGIIH